MWGEEGAYRDLFAPILAFIEASLSAALQASQGPLLWTRKTMWLVDLSCDGACFC